MHDFNIQLHISGLLIDSTDLFFEFPKFKSLAMIGNSWPASGLLYVKAFNHVLYYLTGVTVNYNVVRAGWVHVHAINKAQTVNHHFYLPFSLLPAFFCSAAQMSPWTIVSVSYKGQNMCQQVYLDSCNIQYFTQGYDKIFIFLSPHRDPVYMSPDKTLHRSTFRLHRTHGTAQVF